MGKFLQMPLFELRHTCKVAFTENVKFETFLELAPLIFVIEI